MRQTPMRTDAQPKNFRQKGNWAKIEQEIIERLWKGETLDKVQIGIQFFPRHENSTQLGQNLITGLRKKTERFTGKILVCMSGKYRLLFEDENGEAIHEMGKRRKRVLHAIDSFGRPAEYLLKKNRGEMEKIVDGGWKSIFRTITNSSVEKLMEGTQTSLPETSSTPTKEK